MKNSKSGARVRSKNGDGGPILGREIQNKIGQQLRAMYDDVVNQGVPERFIDLLNRLEKRGEKS
jgi:Anti-sigma factor NepR